MAISDCIYKALKPQAKEVVTAVKTATTATKTGLLVLKTEKDALLASLSVKLAPLKAQKLLLDQAVAKASNLNFIPPEMLQACPDFGQLNGIVNSATAGLLEPVNNILLEINTALAVQSLISVEINQLDAAIGFVTEVESVLDRILSE